MNLHEALLTNSTISEASMDHDQWMNNLTVGYLNATQTPTPTALDYCEIVLLACMVAIGGPLNLICFIRSCNNQHENSMGNSGRRNRTQWRLASSRSMTLRLHLTAANLFIIWIYGLSQISWMSTFSWKGGDLMCKIVKFFHTFCFYLTSNIVLIIALDRVYVTANVEKPPKSPGRRDERFMRLILCWIPWIFAFACSVPQLLVWQVTAPYSEHPNWQQCITIWMTWKVMNLDALDKGQLLNELWTVELQESIYSLAHLVLVFWCPAFVIICSYALIVMRFRKKITNTKRENSQMQKRANVEQFRQRAAKLHFRNELVNSTNVGRLTDVPIVISAPQIFVHVNGAMFSNMTIRTLSRVKRRTIKASACISFAYVACWTPYNALELWRFFHPTLENRALELLSNLIVFNAVLNPLIYDRQWSARRTHSNVH